MKLLHYVVLRQVFFVFRRKCQESQVIPSKGNHPGVIWDWIHLQWLDTTHPMYVTQMPKRVNSMKKVYFWRWGCTETRLHIIIKWLHRTSPEIFFNSMHLEQRQDTIQHYNINTFKLSLSGWRNLHAALGGSNLLLQTHIANSRSLISARGMNEPQNTHTSMVL